MLLQTWNSSPNIAKTVSYKRHLITRRALEVMGHKDGCFYETIQRPRSGIPLFGNRYHITYIIGKDTQLLSSQYWIADRSFRKNWRCHPELHGLKARPERMESNGLIGLCSRNLYRAPSRTIRTAPSGVLAEYPAAMAAKGSSILTGDPPQVRPPERCR